MAGTCYVAQADRELKILLLLSTYQGLELHAYFKSEFSASSET